MIIKDRIYTSYKTHNYCQAEAKWYTKEETPGVYCPNCGCKIRKNRRLNSVGKWDKAY